LINAFVSYQVSKFSLLKRLQWNVPGSALSLLMEPKQQLVGKKLDMKQAQTMQAL